MKYVFGFILIIFLLSGEPSIFELARERVVEQLRK